MNFCKLFWEKLISVISDMESLLAWFTQAYWSEDPGESPSIACLYFREFDVTDSPTTEVDTGGGQGGVTRLLYVLVCYRS